MDKKTSNKYRNTMALWRSAHSEDYNEFLKIVENAEHGDITLIQRMSEALVKKWWYFIVLRVTLLKFLPEKLKTKCLNVVFDRSSDGVNKDDGTFVRCCLIWLYLDGGAKTFVKILKSATIIQYTIKGRFMSR